MEVICERKAHLKAAQALHANIYYLAAELCCITTVLHMPATGSQVEQSMLWHQRDVLGRDTVIAGSCCNEHSFASLPLMQGSTLWDFFK